MQVAGAYILVVFIWSTTPLAIHWSNSSLSFVTAITARMALAALLCLVLLKIVGQPLIRQRRDWLVYTASALGLFPNMLLVYWAAQHISSGLMSVIMGIYPFFVGLFSVVILRENPFSPARVAALLLAVLGLWVVHREQLAVGPAAVWGVAAMVLVCVIWGASSVAVKKLAADLGALRIGTGSLIVALPFFLMAWLWLDGVFPQHLDNKSLFGVSYLVVAGSVLGHTLWFYVLRACSVGSVSIITLITPVMAITWGAVFEGEVLTSQTCVGAGLILTALAIYQGFWGRFLHLLGSLVNPVRWQAVRAPLTGSVTAVTATAHGHTKEVADKAS